MKLKPASFIMHRGITTTQFECPAPDAVAFQPDSTEIEPSPVLRACVYFSWYNSVSVDMAGNKGHNHYLPHPLQQVVHVICF
jgi:hypothetical protein